MWNITLEYHFDPNLNLGQKSAFDVHLNISGVIGSSGMAEGGRTAALELQGQRSY
jgi:hypothetical protein